MSFGGGKAVLYLPPPQKKENVAKGPGSKWFFYHRTPTFSLKELDLRLRFSLLCQKSAAQGRGCSLWMLPAAAGFPATWARDALPWGRLGALTPMAAEAPMPGMASSRLRRNPPLPWNSFAGKRAFPGEITYTGRSLLWPGSHIVRLESGPFPPAPWRIKQRKEIEMAWQWLGL